MKYKIYSVEDDENISYIIKTSLKNANFEVSSFDNSIDLYKKLEEEICDLLILDLMLPGEDGLSILRNIKSNVKYKDIIVIILSAKSSEIDKVKGLDLGADDYIAKPFSVLELISRINAHLRRKNKDEILTNNDIVLNLNERRCFVNNEEVILTLKEFNLLQYFLENINKSLSRENILNDIWGYDFIGETRTIDMHVLSLRNKLGKEGNLIKTVHGFGYKMVSINEV